MNEEKIKALIHLISTESEDRAANLKEELAGIIKYHPSAFRNVLKVNYEGNTPSFIPGLLEDVALDRLKDFIRAFANKINPSLEEVAVHISRFNNPVLKKDSLIKSIDNIALALRPFILNSADGYDVAVAMSEVFYNRIKFRVAAANLRPDHLSFEKFLNTKNGCGLMMALLYCITAARYGIGAGIVDHAGKILVQFTEPVSGNLFYIDPFDNGKILTRKHCADFVESRGFEWREDYEKPFSSHAIMRRALSNMIFVYRKIKDERRLSYLREYLNIING